MRDDLQERRQPLDDLDFEIRFHADRRFCRRRRRFANLPVAVCSM